MALSNLRLDVVKEPLGFIRVIELPLAILAFSTTCGFSACFLVSTEAGVACTKDKLCASYSFNLGNIMVPDAVGCYNNSAHNPHPFQGNYKSSAEFFVATGVLSMLYALLILAYYIAAWSAYETNELVAKVDLGVTAALALFWFAGACAWASGVDGLKRNLAKDKILALFTPCTGKCTVSGFDFASLNVSLVCGFACCALWASNLWFIYKETSWFKSRNPNPQTMMGGPRDPTATAGAGATTAAGGQKSYQFQ